MSSCCVLGLGYIGLPTALLLASSGVNVVGVDVNPHVVNSIRNREVHFFEPGLQTLLEEVLSSGFFTVAESPVQVDSFIIAVPTPLLSSDSIPSPDISYVIAAAESIASTLRPDNLVLLESTCPLGTTLLVQSRLEELTGIPRERIHVAYCPERVIPGRTLYELKSNPRTIGSTTKRSFDLARQLYSRFCDASISSTTSKTAELVKLAENSYRDVCIAFANELSLVSHVADVDVREVIRLANCHPRVNILQPGCGVGGHCIAVDPWFMVAAAPTCTPLIQAARMVNDYKSAWVVDQVRQSTTVLSSKIGRPARVACLGLAFKPDVDDLRESPALRITTELIMTGLDVIACEPNISHHSAIKLCTLEQAILSADLIVLLVAHTQFKDLTLADRVVLDYCGVLDSPAKSVS